MAFLTDLATRIKTWANGRFSLLAHNHDTAYEAKNSNIQTHIGTTGNPHGLTKSDISLGNVTNDAQMKKVASSTNGNVPTWSGTTGDTLGAGYTVETTLTGSSSALPRADAVKAAIDAIQTGTPGTFATPVQDLAALKAVDTTSATTYPDKIAIIVEGLGIYRLDRDSSATNDDLDVIQPTTGTGRWLRMTPSTAQHNAMAGIQGGATNERYHVSADVSAALAGSSGTPSGSNKFVTANDAKISQLSATGTFPVNQIDVLSAEWTAFDNALNA